LKNGHRISATLAVWVVLLAACAPLPTRPLSRSNEGVRATAARHDIARPSTTGFAPGNATPEQRAETVERIWRSIDRYFYDPTFAGIDLPALEARTFTDIVTVHNDAEFYRVLKRNVAAMHDSHTQVLTPRQAEDERTRQATQIGIVFDIVEGSLVVTEVVRGFAADEAGVRPGMLIDAIDGQAIDAAWLARAGDAATPVADADVPDPVEPEPAAIAMRNRQRRAVRALLRGIDGVEEDPPRVHRLTLRRADDTTLAVEVQARTGDVPTDEGLRVLPSGVAVLRLSRFDHALLDRLDVDIERARVASTAMVIDLRGNPGGEIAVFRQFVDHFIERPVALGTLTARFFDRPVTLPLAGEPTAKPYLMPIAVLVDRSTGSAAELTAHALVELRGALPVGERTCGCVVGIQREFMLPDGGALRVAEASFRSPHDRRMEADPLLPVVDVRPTLAEIRAGDDVALRAAERALLAANRALIGSR
jgi:carboxyl-terminal processing protease